MKKYVVTIITLLLIICCFCSCKNAQSDDKIVLSSNSTISNSVDKNIQSAIGTLLKSYFSYYEKGDYENMKQYCSKEFIEAYFHENDVFGSEKSTFLKINNSIKYDKEKYLVSVEEEATPVKSSAYYDEENSQVDIINDYIIKENAKGELVIDSVTTDSTIY